MGMARVRWIPCLVALAAASPAAAEHVHGSASVGHIPPDAVPVTSRVVISAGAGAENFISGALRDVVGIGAGWTAGVSMGAPSAVRVEVTYHGSSQDLVGEGGRLTSHGVQGLLRINIAPWWPVEAFFYTGAGWSRYAIDGMTLGLERTDHVLDVPFGVGVAYRFGRFVADARAGVALANGADLMPFTDPASSAGGETMHRYTLRASLGIEL